VLIIVMTSWSQNGREGLYTAQRRLGGLAAAK